MKIGILTFWGVPNYGCFFQAYALQKYIEEHWPASEVKQIAYLDGKHYDYYYGNKISKNMHFWIINPRFYKQFFDGKKREKVEELRKFEENYKVIPSFKIDDRKELATLGLDLLVLGSDVIWDYSYKLFENDYELFGVGVDAKRVISYATSVCNVKMNTFRPPIIIDAIRHMNAISVRDSISENVISDIAGYKVQKVLDPTLMHDFKNDKNIIFPQVNYNYIVVYGNGFKEDTIIELQKYAKEHEYKLVNLVFTGNKYKWCDINFDRAELKPYEWLGYFFKASAIVTSTYHGLLFSIICEKPVAFFASEMILNKANDLICSLELEDVLMSNKSLNEKISWDWNYLDIGNRLRKLRQESYEYLYNSIENT